MTHRADSTSCEMLCRGWSGGQALFGVLFAVGEEVGDAPGHEVEAQVVRRALEGPGVPSLVQDLVAEVGEGAAGRR